MNRVKLPNVYYDYEEDEYIVSMDINELYTSIDRLDVNETIDLILSEVGEEDFMRAMKEDKTFELHFPSEKFKQTFGIYGGGYEFDSLSDKDFAIRYIPEEIRLNEAKEEAEKKMEGLKRDIEVINEKLKKIGEEGK